MKVLISPAKVMAFPKDDYSISEPIFKDKKEALYQQLKSYDKAGIKELMSVSDKIAEEVISYYHNEQVQGAAIDIYRGLVFKQLALGSYSSEEWDYFQENVRILSALYGVLKPLDRIQRYRLDMTMKLPDQNLYDYWIHEVVTHFEQEDVLISLASKEFEQMVSHPNIIGVDFIEETKGKQRRITTSMKKARGQLLNEMIKNKITDVEGIKSLTIEDYCFSEAGSTAKQLLFVNKK